MTNALERSMDPPPVTQPSLLRAVIFRIGFVYWTLFCVAVVFLNTDGVSWLAGSVGQALATACVWVGKTILGIPYEFSGADNGSGDKTADWVMILSMATLAVVAAVIWSALDRRRARDAWFAEVLRIMVRYALAFTVLGYGVVKLFIGQFPAPGDARLMQRVGDMSPMGLLWTFMGASPAYVFFSGLAETVGSVLLLFRRTTMLGALVLACVLTNVVLLNFCYDVPVKIYSAHYLAMCIVLLLPDLRRLADVIVWNRAVQPAPRDLVLSRRWMRVTRLIAKYGAIGVVLFTTIKSSAQWGGSRTERPNSWYDGTWVVTSFHRDGKEVPANVTERLRWNRFRLRYDASKLLFRLRVMDLTIPGDFYDAVIDERGRTIQLTFDTQENDHKQPAPGLGLGVITLHYTRLDASHLQLEGRVGAEELSMQLEHQDATTMLLTTRGFHWINEEPFNR